MSHEAVLNIVTDLLPLTEITFTLEGFQGLCLLHQMCQRKGLPLLFDARTHRRIGRLVSIGEWGDDGNRHIFGYISEAFSPTHFTETLQPYLENVRVVA